MDLTIYKRYQLTATQGEDGKWSGSAVLPGDADSLMSVEGADSREGALERLQRWIDKKVYTPGLSGMWNRNDGTEMKERRRKW